MNTKRCGECWRILPLDRFWVKRSTGGYQYNCKECSSKHRRGAPATFTMLPEFDEQPACATVDPEIFFPNPGQYNIAAKAKKLCEGCPARLECLDLALQHPEIQGIWGGTTEKERTQLRKGKGAA